MVDDETGSMQRPGPPGDGPHVAQASNSALLRRIDALEREVARLREANEHLVLAAVSDQDLRDEAEAINRRQNEFLAMLAHELRNPLVPISMSSMLIERSANATPQLLDLSKVIRRQVGHMACLLDDLLDAARISSGKITLHPEALSVAATLDQALETVLPRIGERGQELTLAVAPLALGMRGDRVRLVQVLANLIGNASKYTADGGRIALAVGYEADEIVVSVSDNGSGIAPEVLPHIFDLFIQGPRSLARSEGGLGVGLNVVRNLVAMHGGSITADSAGIGQGSRFVLRVPACTPPPAPAPEPEPAAPAAGIGRVLIVEDNRDACAMLTAFLSFEGYTVSVAHDGLAGLEALLAGGVDVVICDIGLPGLDGLEVIRRLRASGTAAQPVAIGLSGYGQAEDRARAMQAGFDHYLVKPVDPVALLALVAARG